MIYMILKYDEYVHQTDKLADQFCFNQTWEWVPQSIILSIDEEENLVEIQEWFCIDHGLEDYSIGTRRVR